MKGGGAGGGGSIQTIKKKVESFLTNLFGHSTLHCHAASRDGAHADTDRGKMRKSQAALSSFDFKYCNSARG